MEFENVSRETSVEPKTIMVKCGQCARWFQELKTVARARWYFGLEQECIKCDISALEKVRLPLSSITKLNNHCEDGGKIECE